MACMWESIRPGITVRPWRSIKRARAPAIFRRSRGSTGGDDAAIADCYGFGGWGLGINGEDFAIQQYRSDVLRTQKTRRQKRN